MRIIFVNLICGIVCISSASVTWTEESRCIESEQVALWESKLTETKLKPKEMVLEDLWLGLRNLGYRKTSEGHSLEVDRVYRSLQNELLSISGHAQYFADKIENERATLKLESYRGTYDFNRRLAFEALSHLPSPETIKVLGGYLDDERDAAKEAMWDSHGILLSMDPNSERALDALRNIGLRDPGFVDPESGKWPSSEDYAAREEERRAVYDYLVARRERQLTPWRAWYAELKTGKRVFSFKGQAVEYRFKPDGTWDTIPIAYPPDDTPGVARSKTSDRQAKPRLAGEVDEPKPRVQKRWLWIGVVGLAILGLLAWILRQKTKI